MNESDLKAFINTGLERWDQIKKGFSNDKEMAVFLKKAYPVILFDHFQLDMDLAKNLYKPLYSDENKAKPEERKAEEFRQKMLIHLENDANGLFLELRFYYIDMKLINELKTHPVIRNINQHGNASIKVVILEKELG